MILRTLQDLKSGKTVQVPVYDTINYTFKYVFSLPDLPTNFRHRLIVWRISLISAARAIESDFVMWCFSFVMNFNWL